MTHRLLPDDQPTSHPRRFVPRHCPWPDCPDHSLTGDRVYRSVHDGSYSRRAAPHRIPRFCCKACGRTFSSQTFSPTYFMKRPELLVPLAAMLTNGSCDRHARRAVAARPPGAGTPTYACAASTVSRLIPRLGREAALFLSELGARCTISEPLVLDDFETFAVTQIHPVAVPTVVGQRSSFVYGLGQAPHRRGGPLTPSQRAAEDALRRAGRLPRPWSRARAWKRIVDEVLDRAPEDRILHLASDDDCAIARAIRRHPRAASIRHRRYPKPERGPKGSPPSAAARTRDRALREVDQLHRWFRHSLAHDRRETIAFSRSVNALLSRKILFAVGRNVVQPRRERRPAGGTPAMQLGLLDRPLSWKEIFERRRFPRRVAPLPSDWLAAYRETILTLGSRPSSRRFPRFAA
jgi:hypothetical protein